MRMIDLLLNKRGVSLPGVMIAGALVAAAAVGVTQLMKVNSQGSAGIRERSELSKTMREIQLTLNNADVCNLNFKDKDAGVTIDSINTSTELGADGTPKHLIRTGEKIHNATYELQEIRIERLDRLKRRAQVSFTFKHLGESITVKESKKFLNLFVETDAAQTKLIRCLDPVTLSSAALLGQLCWDADPENFDALPNDNLNCLDNVDHLVTQMSEIYCTGNPLLRWDAGAKKCLPVDAGVQCEPGSYFKGYTAAGEKICYRRPSYPPSNLSLAHVPNHRNYTVSWTAGMGNGSCYLQYNAGSSWVSLPERYDCDVNTSNAPASFPGDGWVTSFTTVAVRLVRVSDNELMGMFPQSATCSAIAGSVTSTPLIDENCNGYWNDSPTSPEVAEIINFGPCNFGASYSVPDTGTCPDGRVSNVIQVDFGVSDAVLNVYDDWRNPCTGTPIRSMASYGGGSQPRSGTVPSLARIANGLDISLATVTGDCVIDVDSGWRYNGGWKLESPGTRWNLCRAYFMCPGPSSLFY